MMDAGPLRCIPSTVYWLSTIRPRLQKTSEAWINCIFLVMNLMDEQNSAYGAREGCVTMQGCRTGASWELSLQRLR